MKRIANFCHVSREQLETDWRSALPDLPVPEKIELPRRATSGSAGYDFFAPAGFTLQPGETILLPTGVRARMEPGWVLMMYPRSGLGFKYRLQLNNTVGIIDSDYFYAKNEGHIMLKMTNDTRDGRTLQVRAGEGVAQGVFLEFGIVEDDDAQAVRTGGFGSTSK